MIILGLSLVITIQKTKKSFNEFNCLNLELLKRNEVYVTSKKI